MEVSQLTLTNLDLVELSAFRRKLHQYPEVSNEEEKTAEQVVAFLSDTHPDRVITGMGGHGVAIVYDSGNPGCLVRRSLTADFRIVSDSLGRAG